MQLISLITLLGLAAIGMAQEDDSPYDSPCGSYKTCLEICPHEDFQPIIDQCDIGEYGQPDCYVNFYCA